MYESGSGARQLAAKVESLLYMVSLCIILFVYLYADTTLKFVLHKALSLSLSSSSSSSSS